MPFSFTLYRFLTGFILIVSGLFSMIAVLGIIISPSIQALLSAMMVGAPLIQAILSQAIQRSLIHGGYPVKQSTPGGLRVMSIIAIVIGALMVWSFTTLLFNPEAIIDVILNDPAVRKQNPDVLKDRDIYIKTLRVLAGIMIVYGAIILTNCSLALRYLKVWQHRRHDDENITFDIEE
ncbi:hypothetical protein LX64_00262 [Chitinophaga skermanii]|uniref:Uncharacterized protein n=1 Tax=Chitinophaga skermanii TaxID=331697 RepID=A0A327R9R2_9BACT|nr:hypothetical protein [Chitinophaga skermanii]RAJ10657.1 hypothetical protein LX64_00262 [Chitinophaga skermanii]